MTTTIIRPERAFAEDLYRHQSEEEYADRRQEEIEERAEDMMKPGCSYYPWNWENMSEALANAPDSDMKVLSIYLGKALDHNLDQPLTNHLALCVIRHLIEKYWRKIALVEAGKEMK